ncbi:Alpha/Beta hydrolase protein [Jimgerdemannia flammicorona]|uniref:Alpha/Beta hydrolase protein n=1 Tax=Jimgerdemannia flammicorona TaxID=994334 RepID=A0A433QGB2_9FUNG|nr:Alpha/Beta hydrolase protein [Jimgerdemannia flammicorona]
MTLLGHSMGGYFATCYALKYPERVERLILVSPDQAAEIHATTQAITATDPAHLPAEDESRGAKPYQLPPSAQPRGRRIPGWARYLWNLNITPMLIMRMSGPFGPSLINEYTSRRFAHLGEGEQHDLYHISSLPGSGEYALAAILAPGAYARTPLINRLKDIKMPTTFMYGQQDWMDYKAAERAREFMGVPTKVLRIPEAGHHLYLDNPKDFDAAVVTEMFEAAAQAEASK